MDLDSGEVWIGDDGDDYNTLRILFAFEDDGRRGYVQLMVYQRGNFGTVCIICYNIYDSKVKTCSTHPHTACNLPSYFRETWSALTKEFYPMEAS